MKNKKVKRKLNLKKLLILILIVYLTCYSGYYLFNEPIRNIIITGTTHTKDYEIIEIAGIKNYPSILVLNTRTLREKIEELPLVSEVTIKRDLKFRLKINITESKIILINSNNELILSSGESILNNNEYFGIPRLINYAPEKILKDFVKNLSNVDIGILSLINEIEYSNVVSEEGVSIDEERFIIYMNDGNTVYTNVKKCNTLNHYLEIYASLGDQKGILNLDSGSSGNYIFTKY